MYKVSSQVKGNSSSLAPEPARAESAWFRLDSGSQTWKV